MRLYAVRANKRLAITDNERKTYLALGYDIGEVVDGKLKIVQHAPNKKVSYAQYEKLLKENEALKAKLAEGTKKNAKKTEE